MEHHEKDGLAAMPPTRPLTCRKEPLGSCCAEFRSAKKGKTGSDRRRPGHPLRNENHSRLQAVVMTEALKLPYSVQGRGTIESLGNHFYRVCGHKPDKSDCQGTQWFRALEPNKGVSALQS